MEHELTIDTGARSSIVGQRMKAFGERLRGPTPADPVQGLQSRPIVVEGVYCIRCRTVYGQVVVMDALATAGCTDEFTPGSTS